MILIVYFVAVHNPGARVILACRDLTKAERAADAIRKSTGNDNVLVRVIDLASLTSVRKFCDSVLKSESRLDLLINNAGICFNRMQIMYMFYFFHYIYEY